MRDDLVPVLITLSLSESPIELGGVWELFVPISDTSNMLNMKCFVPPCKHRLQLFFQDVDYIYGPLPWTQGQADLASSLHTLTSDTYQHVRN